MAARQRKTTTKSRVRLLPAAAAVRPSPSPSPPLRNNSRQYYTGRVVGSSRDKLSISGVPSRLIRAVNNIINVMRDPVIQSPCKFSRSFRDGLYFTRARARARGKVGMYGMVVRSGSRKTLQRVVTTRRLYLSRALRMKKRGLSPAEKSASTRERERREHRRTKPPLHRFVAKGRFAISE